MKIAKLFSRRFFYILSVFLLLLAGGSIFINYFLDDLLRDKLNLLIQQDENRLYDYDYGQVKIEFLSGNVEVTDLHLIPRSQFLDSLKRAGVRKREVVEVKLELFQLKGLKSWKFLISNELEISEISLDNPGIKLYFNQKVDSAQRDTNRQKNVLAVDVLEPVFKYAKLSTFEIRNAVLRSYEVDTDTQLLMTIDTTNFSVHGIYTDPKLLSGKEILSFEHNHIDLKRVSVLSYKNYRYEIGHIWNAFDSSQLHLEKLRLSPLKNRYDFMKDRAYQTDWFDLEVAEIILHSFSYEAFQQRREIKAKRLLVDGVDLELYRDKRMPEAPAKYKALPSRIIRELPVSVAVDEIKVSNSRIEYQEWEQKAEAPIQVEFSDLELNVMNFTTLDQGLNEDDTITIDFKTRFMNDALFEMQMKLPVLREDDLFLMEGEITGLQLASLNPILKNSLFIEFVEGRLDFMKFRMKANDLRADGILDWQYSGMKHLHVLRNKTEMDDRRRKGKDRKHVKRFLSLLANSYAPENYGPDSKNYWSGVISYERNREKFIFNYLVKSLQTGIITSLMPRKRGDYNEQKKARRHSE